jgi:serine/threonine protein phosphatase PrpC
MFTHVNPGKTDEEINNILYTEFEKTEQFLRENQKEILMKRAELIIKASDLRKGSIPYVSNKKVIESYDTQLKCGTFALISLVIEKRLFIANVGTSHWFICRHIKSTNETQVISYETDHKITNATEMMRLMKLNASIDMPNGKNKPIEYTRCLGNFKLKDYYHEYPQFQ